MNVPLSELMGAALGTPETSQPAPAAHEAQEKMTRRQLRQICTDAKDAERYRGLRKMACSASAAERAKAFEALSHGEWWHEKDAAVDAAIAAQQGKGGEE